MTSLQQRLPWWSGALLGVLGLVLGVILILRPYLSLAALLIALAAGLIIHGVSLLLQRRWTGLLWLALGPAVLLVPGLSIAVLALLVGAALVIEGLTDGARALRRREWSGLMSAATSLILGILALSWPDVTVIVIAVIFGVRLAGFGLSRILPGQEHNPRRGTLRAAAGLVLTVGVAVVGIQLSAAPRPDAFYTAPDNLPAEPGQLLRAEPFERTIPEGARAWRILYTTTVDEGRPAVASGLVVTPDTDAAHPVVAWAHGTTGFATGCAPSLLDEPFVAGAMPDLEETLAQGWAVVATDYVGLGTGGAHPYLIGQAEGRSVLDSIRAARQLGEADLSPTAVIWGHSQGGHAALWAGGLAGTYAPELQIAGVAAMSPAANLPALFDSLNDSAIGSLFGSFALAAYAAEYPEIHARDYVRPGARLMAEAMSRRCLSDPATVVSVATALAGREPIWSRDPLEGPLGTRAEENVPTMLIDAPLLLAQGAADTLVTPAAQEDYVERRRAAGQEIDYRVYEGQDHLSIIAEDSPMLPELREWTQQRLSGGAPSPGSAGSVPR